MAYDKAVDSAVLDSTLTAIADAIREKGGTSDPIAFGAMANAIAAIEAGGDYEIVAGDYVPAEEISVSKNTEYAVGSHNMGKHPLCYLCYTDKFTLSNGFKQSLSVKHESSYTTTSTWYGTYQGANYDATSSSLRQDTYTDYTNTIFVTGYNGRMILAGETIHWLAVFTK